MKNVSMIIFLCLGIVFQGYSQNIDSVIARLTGKWIWDTTFLNGFAGGYVSPETEHYTMSLVFYQDYNHQWTDSINYTSFLNDNIRCSGLSGITAVHYTNNNTYQYHITTEVVNCGYTTFPPSPPDYRIRFDDSTLWLDLPGDLPRYKYRKYKAPGLGINKNKTEFPFVSIFPNPAETVISCKLTNFDTDYGLIRILNVYGQIFRIQEGLLKRDDIVNFDISTLKPGMYIFQLICNGKNITNNFLKK